jgi:hydroxymethylbilane synthase
VFTKELDIATMSDQIQIAVHCMKDLPTTLPQGLYMGAVLERGDTEDVLVLPLSHEKYQRGSLEDLKDGAVIGTSAMRRSASIAKHYPKLVCKNIRGNVNTRLAKLDRSAKSDNLARIGHQCEPLRALQYRGDNVDWLPPVLRLCSQW